MQCSPNRTINCILPLYLLFPFSNRSEQQQHQLSFSNETQQTKPNSLRDCCILLSPILSIRKIPQNTYSKSDRLFITTQSNSLHQQPTISPSPYLPFLLFSFTLRESHCAQQSGSGMLSGQGSRGSTRTCCLPLTLTPHRGEMPGKSCTPSRLH